jgi:alpha-L-fucosidase
VEACREFDLKIGFYSSLMDWHHPDGWRCAFDAEARISFNSYIKELNRELLTQYGKIDILWYDVARPMEHWEGWNSLELNQMVRELQPDIIINNRSLLDEDFGTPEEHLTAMDRDWEACMTFNGISWGYVDSAQALPFSYNAQRIIKMLNTVTSGGGNLLLNIGPMPDGSVPSEVIKPLTTVGNWLSENGKAVYGKMDKTIYGSTSGVCSTSCDGTSVYVWNWIWPQKGEMALGGFMSPVKNVKLVKDGTPIAFEQRGHRILLKNLPQTSPDKNAGVAVLELEFDEAPEFHHASYYPQLHGGVDYAGNNKM